MFYKSNLLSSILIKGFSSALLISFFISCSNKTKNLKEEIKVECENERLLFKTDTVRFALKLDTISSFHSISIFKRNFGWNISNDKIRGELIVDDVNFPRVPIFIYRASSSYRSFNYKKIIRVDVNENSTFITLNNESKFLQESVQYTRWHHKFKIDTIELILKEMFYGEVEHKLPYIISGPTYNTPQIFIQGLDFYSGRTKFLLIAISKAYLKLLRKESIKRYKKQVCDLSQKEIYILKETFPLNITFVKHNVWK